MPTLIITRGLPGSGKTTWARQWVTENPSRHTRVNRDDIRAMFGCAPIGDNTQEESVTVAQRAAVEALLRRGRDVVVDDTNLRDRYVRGFQEIAATTGAAVIVKDFTDIPVDVCVARDAARDRHVGSSIIRTMWHRFIAGRPNPLPTPDPGPTPQPYVTTGGPNAIIVDIDGTVALMGGRSPYDEDTVGDDAPNINVIAVVKAMAGAGNRVIFCSGRTEKCRAATEQWIRDHIDIPYDALHMRQIGDRRKDSTVKLEIFNHSIRHHYNVAGVFDDRRQVVDMWRSLGLTVFQVAPGNF